MELKKYKSSDMTDVKSIAVIMFGLLGDVFIRTPLLKALKEIYPKAIITAIVDPIGEKVLKNNTYCDNIIVVNRNKKNRIAYYASKLNAILDVRKRKLDLIVDFYGGGSSYFLVLVSGAKYKLGHFNSSKKNIYNIDVSDIKRINYLTTYYKDLMLVLSALTSKEFSTKPIFNIPKKVNDKGIAFLNSCPHDIDRVYLLNFGSGGVEKMLEPKKYFLLVQYIYEKHGYIPLIISNPGQEYLQKEFIQKFMKHSTIPFIKLDTLSLDEMGALIKNTSFLITPDTGLMHLAMALDRYIYAIFTYTNPILVNPKTDNFIAVYEEFDRETLFKNQNLDEMRLYEMFEVLYTKIKTKTFH